MRMRMRRPSPATVLSMMALFVALSGSSYAAIKANAVGAKQIKANAVRTAELKDGGVGVADLGDDSVGAAEVQNGAVGSGEIGDGAVTGGDVQDQSLGGDDVADESLGAGDILDGSLRSAEVEDGSLTGDDVQDDSLVGADITRLTGADVAPGTFLGGNVTVQFTQHNADLGPNAEVSIDAFCPAGQVGIGGGVRGDLNNSELTKVTASRPIISEANTGAPDDNGTLTGWRGTFVNENSGAGIRPEVWVICANRPG